MGQADNSQFIVNASFAGNLALMMRRAFLSNVKTKKTPVNSDGPFR